MKKEILIEGMSCGHCVKRVENALDELIGVVHVAVILNESKAIIELDQDVADLVLQEAVDEAGYDVVSIKTIG